MALVNSGALIPNMVVFRNVLKLSVSISVLDLVLDEVSKNSYGAKLCVRYVYR